ncbi:MAG: hypothetical protein JXM68_07190 [Sedimentisphaerales bacterium]|nr:hypothetical protein [Sedimentisphaerales bacterium]
MPVNFSFIVLVLCQIAALACAQEPLKILFIGNSFTYGGPISELVRNIAVTDSQPAPLVQSVAIGGKSLGFHRTNSDTTAAIDKGNWNFVVLQDYSTRPTDKIGDPASFKADAAALYDHIKKNSPRAKIVMYQTWARHENNDMYPEKFSSRDEMQQQLIRHYHDCVEHYIPANASSDIKTDVLLAPAGEAWHENYHARNLMLHDTDLYHAGIMGQYLNALVIYSTIYERPVAGLKPLLNIETTDAEYLQSISDKITTKYKKTDTKKEPENPKQ